MSWRWARRRAPSFREYEAVAAGRSDMPSAGTIRIRFVTWNAALAAAGLPPTPTAAKARRWSDEDMLAALRCVEGSPVKYEAARGGRADMPAPFSIIRRFGSWRAARAAAGFPSTGATGGAPRRWSDGDMIAAIRRVAEAQRE